MLEINERLTLREIEQILYEGEIVKVSEKFRNQVIASYDFLEEFSKDKVIYGINTGFGPMAQWRIEDDHLKELQYNIIRSHSTGAGERLPDICVKAAMLSRLMTFLEGHSGVHVSLIDLLVEFINRGIFPVVPRHGSVGATRTHSIDIDRRRRGVIWRNNPPGRRSIGGKWSQASGNAYT